MAINFLNLRASLEEKTLTPAEKKKREEVAKAIEREHPNMPMGMKMAIATKTAKRVAEEEELDELNQMTLARYQSKAKSVGMQGGAKSAKHLAGAKRAGEKLKYGNYSEENNIVAVIDGKRSDRKYNDADHAHNSLSKLVGYQKAKKAELYVNGEKTKHYELNKKYNDFEPKKLSEENKSVSKAKNLKTILNRHSELAIAANKDGDHEAVKYHQAKMNAAKSQMAKLTKEEVEQLDEMTAPERFKDYHNETAKLLKGIHKALSTHHDTHKKDAHWGHVGDIRHYHDQLRDIHDRLHEQGEYAKSAKQHAEKMGMVMRGESVEEQHYCAKHVYSELFGEGQVVEADHAEPDENGNINWYNVQFTHGIEKVFTEDIEIMVAEYHANHKRKKRKMMEDDNGQ